MFQDSGSGNPTFFGWHPQGQLQGLWRRENGGLYQGWTPGALGALDPSLGHWSNPGEWMRFFHRHMEVGTGHLVGGLDDFSSHFFWILVINVISTGYV